MAYTTEEVYNSTDGLLFPQHEGYVLDRMNEFVMTMPFNAPADTIEKAKQHLQQMYKLKVVLVVMSKNPMLERVHRAGTEDFVGTEQMFLHGTKTLRMTENIVSSGLKIDETQGFMMFGKGAYVGKAKIAWEYSGNRDSKQHCLVNVGVRTGYADNETKFEKGEKNCGLYPQGVYCRCDSVREPKIWCLQYPWMALVKGYIVLQECESGDFTREIVNNHFRYLTNVHFRRITDEWEQKSSVGGAAVGGAAVGGAAGGIFPGASFLPGTVKVYPADVGAICNGTTFKQDDIVTVNRVLRATYSNVLHSDPTQNKAKIQIVYSTNGIDWAMVEMIDSLRKKRVEDANANAALISIGSSYKQAKTHMKVKLNCVQVVPPAVVQVGATAALVVPASAAVALANVMQTAMAGLFAAAPAKDHICGTANCKRVTWDAKPGYCCMACQNGTGSKHSQDCGLMHESMKQLFESSAKKQKQEGGSRSGGGA